jgi:hypothetical protein
VNLLKTLIRVHPPDGALDEYVEWEAEIGVIEKWKPSWSGPLGQIGCFDRWTVTIQRAARTVVVEEMTAFDERFGFQLQQVEAARSRRSP